MRFTVILSSLFLFGSLFAQKHHQVEYVRFSNGKVIENQDTILLLSSEHSGLIASKRFIQNQVEYPFEMSWFNASKRGLIHQVTFLDKEQAIAALDSSNFEKYNFEITGETKLILGYTCKKAITKINSNTISLWFTEELGIYGGPTSLGAHLGLILEYERNGNFAIRANQIKKNQKIGLESLEKLKNLPYYSALEYRELVWKSRFTTIPVFKNQVINFDPDYQQNDLELQRRFADGTLYARKIKFPKIQKGFHLFVDAKIQSNGDAYDRTASIVALPVQGKKTIYEALISGKEVLPVFENGNGKSYHGVVSNENYQAPLELMRLFTSFGNGHFNHIELKDKKWHDEVPFRQDISELIPIFSDAELWIVVFIGNYDKGGHKVDLNFTIHESDSKVFPSNQVVPLFNTTNIMEMAGQEYATMFSSVDGLYMNFTLDKPMKNAYLRYISTGHGGWENGDEFLPKINSIELNGKIIHQFIPWRQDCGSFRLYNPASGNFSNGLSSSDYSRSNWCPGTLTNPEYIFMGDLPAGTHHIRVRIPMGDKEGSSFSAWNVSGVIFGE